MKDGEDFWKTFASGKGLDNLVEKFPILKENFDKIKAEVIASYDSLSQDTNKTFCISVISCIKEWEK